MDLKPFRTTRGGAWTKLISSMQIRHEALGAARDAAHAEGESLRSVVETLQEQVAHIAREAASRDEIARTLAALEALAGAQRGEAGGEDADAFRRAVAHARELVS